MSQPPKMDRKSLKQPDTFVQRGQSIVAWLFEQRVRVLPLLIGAAVLAAAIYAFDWWSERKMEKAWLAFTKADKTAEPQRWEELQKLSNEWKGTRPAFFASVALADHHFSEAKKEALKAPDAKLSDAGQTAANAAIEWYSKSLEFGGLLPAEKQLLYVNRGGAKELQGKIDDAMADYKMAVDFGGDNKPIAMLSLARAHELKNDTQKAVETYERITVDFSNTEYARLAKSYLRRLKSPLFQAQAPAQGKS